MAIRLMSLQMFGRPLQMARQPQSPLDAYSKCPGGPSNSKWPGGPNHHWTATPNGRRPQSLQMAGRPQSPLDGHSKWPGRPIHHWTATSNGWAGPFTIGRPLQMAGQAPSPLDGHSKWPGGPSHQTREGCNIQRALLSWFYCSPCLC